MKDERQPSRGENMAKAKAKAKVEAKVKVKRSIEPRHVSDELAYVLPMAVFLGFIYVGSLSEKLYAPMYVARAVLVAVLLILFWPRYTRLRWDGWWLGVIVGVVGIFQWVGMQLWLEQHVPLFKRPEHAYNPFN